MACPITYGGHNMHTDLKYLTSLAPKIWWEPQNLKNGSHDPDRAHLRVVFTLNLKLDIAYTYVYKIWRLTLAVPEI